MIKINCSRVFFLKNILFILIILNGINYSQDLFIRLNQVGYLIEESKRAIVFSNNNLEDKVFYIKSYISHTTVYSDTLTPIIGQYGNFNNYYEANFSSLNENGRYYFEIENRISNVFSVNNYIYNNVVDSLITFFKIQRCGFNEALYHDFCHYHDATSIVINNENYDSQIDLTGGWHDAGDYIKFLNTTAYAAYTLLFSYEFNKSTFGFSSNNNYLPDIIEEAKIGVDWLIKANYNNSLLVTQVQDLRDQNQGWRLPENDNLTSDRPAYLSLGKNLIGIYSATMALSYRIFNQFPGYEDYANKCLTLAENFYSLRDSAPNIHISATGHYQDSKYHGKLALSSIELYLSTKLEVYLDNAKFYAEQAGSDYWWSWGDINSFAHYRISKIDSSFNKYLFDNLLHFHELSKGNIFNESITNTWGTNSANLGVALQAILWKDLTGDLTFDKLAIRQRDYIIGNNPWGISFIYGVGDNSTKNFHSQVAYYNMGKLTGAVSAGPISEDKLNQYSIPYESIDEYKIFQSPAAMYRDDRMDYITNEPTITANATAVFVFGFYSNR